MRGSLDLRKAEAGAIRTVSSFAAFSDGAHSASKQAANHVRVISPVDRVSQDRKQLQDW